MRELLQIRYTGLTVAAALYKWAPPVENNVNAYLKNVSSWCGLQPDDILTAENIG